MFKLEGTRKETDGRQAYSLPFSLQEYGPICTANLYIHSTPIIYMMLLLITTMQYNWMFCPLDSTQNPKIPKYILLQHSVGQDYYTHVCA